MDKSRIKMLFSPAFYIFQWQRYCEAIHKDRVFNATFRFKREKMTWREKQIWNKEWKAVQLYRKYQVNAGNIWGFFYRYRLYRYSTKTGIDFAGNKNFGAGLVIGHWGRILINKNAKFGNEIMLTHGVTIGRDIRGERAGAPTIGNRVCIRTNSTVVGNITIGDDVLIAPNTFVNFDVPSHSIVIGNPASIHHRENATEGHLGWLNE